MLKYLLNINTDRNSALVILVHGRAGNLNIMSTFKRCIPEEWNVLFVEAPHPDPIGGFSWWRLGSEDSPDIASSQFLAAIDQIFLSEGISPSKLVAVGFSQGAALLSIVAQTDPERFAAIAFLAGFVFRRQILPNKRKPKLFFAHGANDETVSLEKAKQGYEYLTSQGYEAEFHADQVGHKIGTAGMRQLKEWLNK